MEWELIPGTSIGPIEFGASIESLGESIDVHKYEDEWDGTDRWAWYRSDAQDVLIQTCNDSIVAVICERSCTFKGEQLIGLSESEVRRLLSGHAIAEGRVVELGRTLEIPSIGVEISFSGGRVESLIVSVDPDSVL